MRRRPGPARDLKNDAAMRIDLGQVRQQPYIWRQTVEVDAAELDDDAVLALGPIDWSGRISYAEPAFYLRARLAYEQTLACHRCLAPVVEPVETEVELLLEVDGEQPMAGEHELGEDDLGVVQVDGEVFDPRPLLVEQLQLAVPMKPLCRDECPGLCPRCGADLKDGDCGCKDERVDPRWAALAKLKTGSDASEPEKN